MELSLENAHAIVVQVMRKFEQNTEYASIIADHIIDCELRGLSYGGLARILSITERLQRTGNPKNLVEVILLSSVANILISTSSSSSNPVFDPERDSLPL